MQRRAAPRPLSQSPRPSPAAAAAAPAPAPVRRSAVEIPYGALTDYISLGTDSVFSAAEEDRVTLEVLQKVRTVQGPAALVPGALKAARSMAVSVALAGPHKKALVLLPMAADDKSAQEVVAYEVCGAHGVRSTSVVGGGCGMG